MAQVSEKKRLVALLLGFCLAGLACGVSGCDTQRNEKAIPGDSTLEVSNLTGATVAVDFDGDDLIPPHGVRTKMRPILSLLVAGLLAGPASAPCVTGRVVGVHDGDTITVLDAAKVQHKIRLNGIPGALGLRGRHRSAFGLRRHQFPPLPARMTRSVRS